MSLVGFPTAWVSAVNFLGLNEALGNSISVLVFALILGVAVWFKERKSTELKEKREEIDNILSELTT